MSIYYIPINASAFLLLWEANKFYETVYVLHSKWTSVVGGGQRVINMLISVSLTQKE